MYSSVSFIKSNFRGCRIGLEAVDAGAREGSVEAGVLIVKLVEDMEGVLRW